MLSKPVGLDLSYPVVKSASPTTPRSKDRGVLTCRPRWNNVYTYHDLGSHLANVVDHIDHRPLDHSSDNLGGHYPGRFPFTSPEMNEDIPQTATTREAWMLMIRENRELKQEIRTVRGINEILTRRIDQAEARKKLWLKRAGWALFFICLWLVWYAHKHPDSSDPFDRYQ